MAHLECLLGINGGSRCGGKQRAGVLYPQGASAANAGRLVTNSNQDLTGRAMPGAPAPVIGVRMHLSCRGDISPSARMCLNGGMAKERHGRWEPPREFTAEPQELYAATEGQDHLATNEKRTAEKRASENRESEKAEVAKTETNYEGETQKNTEKHKETQRETRRARTCMKTLNAPYQSGAWAALTVGRGRKTPILYSRASTPAGENRAPFQSRVGGAFSRSGDWQLESCQHPPAGMPALRGATRFVRLHPCRLMVKITFLK